MRVLDCLLLFGVFTVIYQGQMVTADWLSDLLSNVDKMNQKLQIDIQRMNQEIQKNVDAEVARANADVKEALKNIEKGNFTTIVNGGKSIVINGTSGNSRTVYSGIGSNGKPYYIESDNLVVGDTLIHTERVYNYTTKHLEEYRYTLNLTDPHAKPVYQNATTATPIK